MLFWSQSVTSPRPPTAPQWTAVRIKAYIGDIRNPIGVIPDVAPVHSIYALATRKTEFPFLDFSAPLC